MKFAIVLSFAAAAVGQTWTPQSSGSTASLRGVIAVNSRVAWGSGTGGTFLKTTDGGATWIASKVAGAESLDFRDIHATSDRVAWLMSAGTGDKARIYKTVDGGANWKLLFTNPDAKGFFDAFAFWDAAHAVLVGDPVEGHIVVMTTDDGGEHWERRPTPPAVGNEGAFAASGTCLITAGRREAWFVTGGPQAARVFHSTDRGRTWTVATTPLRNDGASAGIFSIGFRDARHGIAVGGDYNKPESADGNIALTEDGGRTWKAPAGTPPKGFRSAVVYLPERKMWVATGTSGSDFSTDDGKSWKPFDSGAYNAMSFAGGTGWAVGPRGRVARFR